MDVVLAVGAVAGAIVALLTATTLGVRIATKVAAPHFAEAVRSALEPTLSHINSELSVNGGQSVKDTTIRTSAAVEQLAESMEQFREYQEDRNHDLINQQTTTLAVMKLLHRQQLRDMGWSEEDLDELVIVSHRPTKLGDPPGPPEDVPPGSDQRE